jgi:hypothetical protein
MVAIVKYAENFVREAEKPEQITFRKISGWDTFVSYTAYTGEVIDYLLSGGFPEE